VQLKQLHINLTTFTTALSIVPVIAIIITTTITL